MVQNNNLIHAFSVARKVCCLPSELDPFWKINSAYPSFEDPKLILIHTNKDYDPERVSHAPLSKIRGVIIDVEREVILVETTGHDEILTTNTPIQRCDDGSIEFETLISKAGSNDRFIYRVGTKKFNRYFITPGFEGAILRIFKWNGRIFIATFKTLLGEETSIPGRPSFYDLYKRCGGIPAEILYDMKSPSCNVVHNFLISTNELKTVSSFSNEFILVSYHTYCNVKEEDCLCHEDKDHLSLPVAETSIDVNTANKILFPQKFIKKSSIDKSLAPGELKIVNDDAENPYKITDFIFNPTYQNDERLQGGDFVMIFDRDTNTFYRVESPAYTFRREALDGNINLYNQFIRTISYFSFNDAKHLFNNNTFSYPLIVDVSNKDNGKNKYHRILPINTRAEKHIYVQAFYSLVLSPPLRPQIKEWISKYHKDVSDLATFFANNIPTEEFIKANPIFTTKTIEVWKSFSGNNIRNKDFLIKNIKERLYDSKGISIGPLIAQYRKYSKKDL